jgi:hypothetical protein
MTKPSSGEAAGMVPAAFSCVEARGRLAFLHRRVRTKRLYSSRRELTQRRLRLHPQATRNQPLTASPQATSRARAGPMGYLRTCYAKGPAYQAVCGLSAGAQPTATSLVQCARSRKDPQLCLRIPLVAFAEQRRLPAEYARNHQPMLLRSYVTTSRVPPGKATTSNTSRISGTISQNSRISTT